MELEKFIDLLEEKKDFDEALESEIKNRINSKNHRAIVHKVIMANNSSKSNDIDFMKYVFKGYEDYHNNKFLMKNDDILFENYFLELKNKDINLDSKEIISYFENFNDDVQKSIIRNKANKLKKRILSKKYEYLCNHNTEKLFLEMAHLDFTKDELQKFVGKKLSAFHHPEELNGALLNLIEIKEGWNKEKLIEKLKHNCTEGVDYTISYDKDDLLIVDAHTFKATSTIGSKMWCITREKPMFNYYKEQGHHIDYKFCFDYKKEPSDDLSMVALLTTLDGHIDEFYAKDDSLLNENVELKSFYKNILDEHYKEEYSFVSRIRKLSNNTHIEDNQLKGQKFNPNNESHIIELAMSSKSFFEEISRDYMESNQDVFDLNNFEGDYFRIIDNDYIKETLVSDLKYGGDIKDNFEKRDLPENELKRILEIPQIKEQAVKNSTGFSSYLISSGKYGLAIDFMLDEDVFNKLIEKSSYDYLEFNNPFKYISNNDNYFNYLKENNRIKDIVAFSDKLKTTLNEYNVNNNQEDKRPQERLLFESYMDTLLDYTHNKENLEKAYELIPDLKNYVCSFANHNYMKGAMFERMNYKDSELFKHYDFSDNTSELLKKFCEKLISVSKDDYNRPTKDELKYYFTNTNNFINYFDKVYGSTETTIRREKTANSLAELLNAVKNENSEPEYEEIVVKNNPIKDNIRSNFILEGLDTILAYRYSDDSDNNHDRKFLDVYINLAKKAELEGKIPVDKVISHYIDFARSKKASNEYSGEDSPLLSDDTVTGLKYLISTLKDANLLNLNSLDKLYTREMSYIDGELNPAIKIAKNIIDKKENNSNKLKI